MGKQWRRQEFLMGGLKIPEKNWKLHFSVWVSRKKCLFIRQNFWWPLFSRRLKCFTFGKYFWLYVSKYVNFLLFIVNMSVFVLFINRLLTVLFLTMCIHIFLQCIYNIFHKSQWRFNPQNPILGYASGGSKKRKWGQKCKLNETTCTGEIYKCCWNKGIYKLYGHKVEYAIDLCIMGLGDGRFWLQWKAIAA